MWIQPQLWLFSLPIILQLVRLTRVLGRDTRTGRRDFSFFGCGFRERVQLRNRTPPDATKQISNLNMTKRKICITLKIQKIITNR